ncbi:phosphohistidine phosphatase [Friedmanniella luteola]|uniref:Phosphohistidine phosphatase n=1 Tax=Friedmanniella luteola TaxID=546871 RepID=A0A1H1LNU7_9ACTN|nr:histidine phosphatase family protein [Friedmanniella luteola]SDR76228.1 phosphohistidine phosphatase [Friedmanniella luteola]
MTTTRTLLLLRHATAEPARPGHADADRRLSSRGEAEADGVGAFLREQGLVVDRVLCSPAVRTRQTLERLGLDAPVELVPLLYQAGSDEVLELVAAADVATVLVVGHAPAVPGVVYDVADPGSSSPAASAAVADRFPPATLARLEVAGSWADPSSAVLVEVRLPAGADGQHFV